MRVSLKKSHQLLRTCLHSLSRPFRFLPERIFLLFCTLSISFLGIQTNTQNPKHSLYKTSADLDREPWHSQQEETSSAAMAESPKNHRKSYSSGSDEVPVEIEPEITSGSSSSSSSSGGKASASGGGGGGGSVNNGSIGSSGIDGRSFSKVNTMTVEITSVDKFESTSSQPKLGKSKTERPRHPNILAEEAAQIFNDKISVQQKLKLLNRIATVKDDGTVEFEVPGDVEPETLGVGSGDVYNEVDDEPVDATDLQYIPPMQIVILIVGTRGDVQPFIAIGKRLQDYGHRVRLATHSNFKEFVLTAGLEFYPLGGDPKVLAGCMYLDAPFVWKLSG